MIAAPSVEGVLRLLREEGSRAYFGEAVTITEHQLQAARQAEIEGAAAALIVAALLHDIGWVLQASSPESATGPHEQLGAEWLSSFLPPAVTEPVRLHVVAKRYLCATRPGYDARLSDASRRTLVDQGGPLEGEAVRDFEANAYASDAVRLRLWDDLAKVPGAWTRDLDQYAPLLRALAAN